jgi:hypothetical protein
MNAKFQKAMENAKAQGYSKSKISPFSSSFQRARNYTTTLKEGVDWKRATPNSSGKNIITGVGFSETADWKEGATGRSDDKLLPECNF